MKYCESTSKTLRWKTREVFVGKVGVGGNNPIRIQSMTTSSTRDVEATVDQIMKLSDYGCEIARVTVQGKKEAEACEHIKNGLIQKGYDIPLVADIHFYPPAAMMVVDFVDKVRVNPGNYVDRRAIFKTIDYTDESYSSEILKIEEGFSPLVEKCIKLKRAMRIGTNHGSLSDRIMNRYGDTPKGMVESALEFARVCRKLNYHDFMFSMKASNPLVMMQAYRLLVAEMMKLGWDYPLHLGVTEAGDGEDGRVKSSVGTGSLLLDGIGDTIRVSLTEDPWLEIDPCQRLVNYFETYEKQTGIEKFEESFRDITDIKRRETSLKESAPLHRDGSVFVSTSEAEILDESFFENVGFKMQFQRPVKAPTSIDALILHSEISDQKALSKLKSLQEIGVGVFSHTNQSGFSPIYSLESIENIDLCNPYALVVSQKDLDSFEKLHSVKPDVILLKLDFPRLHNTRRFFEYLIKHSIKTPVLHVYDTDKTYDDLVIQASTEMGACLADGFGEGLLIEAPNASINQRSHLSFNILQACRMRSFKTEFIACPGCGRTLFGLQEVTQKIREKTSHLPGVKIAIMGCIVNGPGEMADADFGYVGSRAGKIDLYVGKTCVERNIDADIATDRLIDLIKKHGRWVEPEVKEEALTT